ncbi:metallophosphoesterase family protein [Clostridium botulinum]|uniref:Conserved domain protein n=1 Tax=Clostridium botulinum (strain Langeland / NCTC 10281 / Type F) TaxID=441772 RepID=A7GEI0_CLOBL|nr:metallophosphoesterase family protein [Clostridium botulinum]ABS42545.1 conserved domain protein [Clostridium botulinum F str. Langeland]ADF99606.1 conserved domain protein [Clostridium botulinum F str. 230613]KKM42819.1 metallophosphatase [Clostridium botulinum]MBY6791664.1 metallophosphatase family protein [Clostridium botulinum]MBY6936900.1 metallophosphatase family protein [Clostridium botulinum]
MIFVTGDTHIPRDIEKLNFVNYKNLTKDDYVIICGDFGAIWNNSKQELYWRELLSNKPWTTLFLDGNHENFDLLYQFPVEEWHGGKVHKINNSIYHLMRGQVFNINGLKFWTMGGATSTDKENRREHITWWKEEIPDYNEMREGLDNLKKHNNKVDYIVTHTCSSLVLKKITEIFGFQPKPEEDLNKYFEIMEENVDFKHWYFGHLNEDIEINAKHTLLFEKIIKL